MEETTMWGMHGGKQGDADHLFREKSLLVMGWDKIGDMSHIPPDREAFKKAVAAAYPDKKPGAIPNNAGQLVRFVHEMKPGDFVVYPSNSDRMIHIGTVQSDYVYDPRINATYPNMRKVRWLKSIARTQFSQGALYEIGSAMSLFQVKNYADEFRAAVEGRPVLESPTEDESVALVAEDIEETTTDFVLKALARDLKGHPLARFVAHLLQTMGYRTRVSPVGPDGGIDILAHRDELGFEPPIVKVQVKATEGSVGDPIVSQLYGKVDVGEFGLLVTLGTFTSQARMFARGKGNLRLIDGQELVGLVLAHYEDFDSKYKGMLPLRRVYIPQSIAEDQQD